MVLQVMEDKDFKEQRRLVVKQELKLKKFNLYPNYKITSKKKTWREMMVLQKNQLKSLREALVHKSDTVEVCTKYWISMPSIDSHCGHPVEEKAVFGQRIHPLLVSKITEMVMAGITKSKGH